MPVNKRILIIEDHDDSRKLLAKLLQGCHFDVLAYPRCEPAERHLRDGDIDVALLDVRLPGRSGDDYGKELRGRWPKTMIVFVTAEPQAFPLRQAVPGCFVFHKPFDPKLLMELLECVM